MTEAIKDKDIYLGVGDGGREVVLNARKGQPIPAPVLAAFEKKLIEVGVIAGSGGKQDKALKSIKGRTPTTNTREK